MKDETDYKSLLYNTLIKEAFLHLNKGIARETNLDCAALLADLLSKERYFSDKNELQKDGSFFNEQINIEWDTTLSPFRQRSSLKILRDKGFIETDLRGLPKRTYYKLNHENIVKVLIYRGKETSPMEVKKLNSNKNNSNNSISKDIQVDEKSSNSSDSKNTKHIQPLLNPEDNPFKQYSYIDAFTKYVHVIDRNFIKVGGIKTAIRKDTVTMRTALRFIQQIQQGVFVKFNTIKTDGLLKDADWSILDRKYNDQELEILFKKVSTRLKKIMNLQNDYKRPNTIPYLPYLFLNERSHMSYFVYLACCPLQKVNKAREKSIVTNLMISLTKLDPKFKELSNKIYNVTEIDKLEPEDQLKYWANIRAMMEWRTRNKRKLAPLNDGWRTLFGSTGLMFQTIARFLEDFPVTYKPNFLVIDGYNWNDFIYFCMNGWGVDILGKKKRRG